MGKDQAPFTTARINGKAAYNLFAGGSVAKFVSLSDTWPILVIEESDDLF